MKPDIERLLELQRLLAAFNQIDRQVHRKHEGRFVAENDTEHSYNLAITAWFLAQYFPKLERERLLTYSLVHDLVEVHAGDTYIYGSDEELASKQQREAQALARLQKEWADFPELLTAMEAYETRANEEARFVYALDKLMPLLLVFIHDGYSWKKHQVTAAMVYHNKRDKIELAPELVPYFDEIYQLLLAHPEIIAKE